MSAYTAFYINVHAAIFNTVSQIMYPINQPIWFHIAAQTHQRLWVIESQYDFVTSEIYLMFMLLFVGIWAVVRRLAR